MDQDGDGESRLTRVSPSAKPTQATCVSIHRSTFNAKVPTQECPLSCFHKRSTPSWLCIGEESRLGRKHLFHVPSASDRMTSRSKHPILLLRILSKYNKLAHAGTRTLSLPATRTICRCQTQNTRPTRGSNMSTHDPGLRHGFQDIRAVPPFGANATVRPITWKSMHPERCQDASISRQRPWRSVDILRRRV